MRTSTAAKKTLKLRDRLSHLSLRDAERLLGPGGAALIRQGGRLVIDVEENVTFDGETFQVSFEDGSRTVLSASSGAAGHISWECSACREPCLHVGSVLSLILEEKTVLGLAAPPEPDAPIELLTEDELVERALADRVERAAAQKMRAASAEPGVLWTDYTVTNPESGRSYRVALRGWERGESYCTCPDFRTNTLGTCKHILHVAEKMKKRFPAKVRNQPYEQRDIAVALRYGPEIELHVLLPPGLPADIESLLNVYRGSPVTDVQGLMRTLAMLDKRGVDYIVYPDAEEYIQQNLLQDHLRRRMAEVRRDPAGHPLRRELLKAELLPYQMDGIAFAAGAGRTILADDMGLGKTIQGIGVAELLANEAAITRVLVICPASVKSQWRSEIQRFSDRDCQLVLGNAEERIAQYDSTCFFTVCNYEQVLRDIQTIERVKWDLIILDEGQRIKNWEAKTSRVIKGLSSPFALVLSGTPLENRLEELFSVVQFVDEHRLGPAFRFLHRHRVVDERGRVEGYRNLDELREKLKPILLRRTRQSVMRDLPPRTNEVVRITPTQEQLDIHTVHLNTVSMIVRKQYISEMDLLRLQKALLMCRLAANGSYLVTKEEPNCSSKLDKLGEIIEEMVAEESRKVILFSEWKTMLDFIEPLLDRHGAGYVRLDGSVPQKKRGELVSSFSRNPECKFFLTTNAGATGLNLQAADTVINVDLPWNPAVLEQRIARAHRMGQKRPVQVYLLVTEDTLEERLLYTLATKQELANASIDMTAEINEIQLQSGIEELKRRMETLLGEKPEAPVDVTEKEAVVAEAERLNTERRKRIADAGGQLMTSAFAFLGELLPAGAQPAEQTEKTAAVIRSQLEQCLTKTDDGNLQLTVNLPDTNALDNLAKAVANLAGAAGQVPPGNTP